MGNDNGALEWSITLFGVSSGCSASRRVQELVETIAAQHDQPRIYSRSVQITASMLLNISLLFFFSSPCILAAVDHKVTTSSTRYRDFPGESYEVNIGETLVFEEDFSSFDLSVWKHEVTMSGGGNWEFQVRRVPPRICCSA